MTVNYGFISRIIVYGHRLIAVLVNDAALTGQFGNPASCKTGCRRITGKAGGMGPGGAFLHGQIHLCAGIVVHTGRIDDGCAFPQRSGVEVHVHHRLRVIDQFDVTGHVQFSRNNPVSRI